MESHQISHEKFVEGYNSGQIKAHVDRSAAGYFFEQKGLISDSHRRKQAFIRFLFFGGIILGVALLFFTSWYYGAISIVFGVFMANRAQGAAVEGLLSAAINDRGVYELAIENKALVIEFDASRSSPESSSTHPNDQEVVAAFGELIEKSSDLPLAIFDTSMLPYNKDVIRDSLVAIYRNSADEDQKEVCKIGLLELANYQDGVGPEPVLGAPDLSDLLSIENNPEALIDAVLDRSGDVPSDRYAELQKLAESEYQGYLRLLGGEAENN
jgi:hypothetical protein